MTSTHGIATSTEERALALLGSGVGPETVASALGVSVSRISQLLSSEEFSAKVAQLRFESLSRHNTRDNKYDSIEDTLLENLEKVVPAIYQPGMILKAISTINNAKRRGSSAPEQLTNQSTVVNLTMPTQIVQKFSVNINNQVIEAGSQSLLTIQSGTLLNRIRDKLQENLGDLNEAGT